MALLRIVEVRTSGSLNTSELLFLVLCNRSCGAPVVLPLNLSPNMEKLTQKSSIDYYPVDCLIDIILTQADIAKNPALKVDDFTKIRTKYHVQITPDQQDEANGGVKVSNVCFTVLASD